MSSLLKGQKKFFRRNEVKSVIVPISPWLTVKKVIQMVSKIPKIMSYLPDESELLASRTSRDYLFTIVHTLDSEFFPGAMKEIEELKGIRLKTGKIQTIELDSEMVRLLE